jgi:segregation and condensation protein B
MSKPYDSLIEAILFSESQPQNLTTLAKRIGCAKADISESINVLKEKLANRGVTLVESHAGYELAVAPKYRDNNAIKANETAPNLSQSSLEVLTVIAYDGPCPKAIIDEVRAAPSDNSLRALLSRDLIIQIKSPINSNGNPSYELTSFAWRCLGITSRSELPPKPAKKGMPTNEAK